MYIRNINENAMLKFKMLLNAESWNKVLIENDTNKAYSTFSEHFFELHDTCTKITTTCKYRGYIKTMVSKRFIKCI